MKKVWLAIAGLALALAVLAVCTVLRPTKKPQAVPCKCPPPVVVLQPSPPKLPIPPKPSPAEGKCEVRKVQEAKVHDADDRPFPPVQPAAPAVPVELPLETQRVVAKHEAAHGVAVAMVEGVDKVKSISVATSYVVPADATAKILIGVVDWPLPEFFLTPTSLRKAVVVYLAGRAGERVLLGKPSTTAEYDLQNANRLACTYHFQAGFGDSLLQRTNCTAVEGAERKQLSDELALMDRCAELIIRANRATVVKLADKLMGIEPVANNRVMSRNDFVEFMRGVKLVKPKVPRGLQVCAELMP